MLRHFWAIIGALFSGPLIGPVDRAFWVVLRRLWSRWADAVVIVKPETVVGWHRAGFALYWTWLSRRRRSPGRAAVGREVRDLVRRLASENGWGAPRIHGELMKLGFKVSERTVSRYMRQEPHGAVGGAAAAGGFPLRRCRWQLEIARVRSRQDLLSAEVVAAVSSMTLEPTRTSYQSPWQNGVAERFVGTVRRELLDHAIVLDDEHLRRLLGEYPAYYHEDRTHLGVDKDAPLARPVERRPAGSAAVHARRRVGGLHHRYTWTAAA